MNDVRSDPHLSVVSDGSAFQREPGSTVLTDLLTSAALLREHAGMAANAVLVTAGSDRELIAELHRLASTACGVYLTHTHAVRAHNAQVALAGDLPVIIDLQTTAVAVTAATLTTLDRAGITPAASTVVIIGADRNTLVGTLAATAGIGHIDSITRGEASRTRRDAAIGQADAVIDLQPGAGTRTSPVIAVTDPSIPLLALPGLLTTAHRTARPVSVDDCLATALNLVARTPADQLLPSLAGLTAKAATAGSASALD